MSNVNEQNSNVNEQNQSFLEHKRKKTRQKSNGLYIVYDLSDADLMSDLYTDYIKIEDKKQLRNKRRAYLIEQEKKYKMNKMEFPEWAQKELNHLREIKREDNRRYRQNNWAAKRLNSLVNRKQFQETLEHLKNNKLTSIDRVRGRQYNKEWKIYTQLINENKEYKLLNKEQIQKMSPKEYQAHLSEREQKTKSRHKELSKIADLWETQNIQHVPNHFNIIDLDEDKMEQNQQINK